MNLTQLRYFVAVVKYGSMTRAAETEFISQSAISKMIKQLETELGVQLFDRIGKNIKLNRHGKLFYSYVNDGLKLIDHGVRDVTLPIDEQAVPLSVLFLVTSPMIPKITLQIKKNLPDIRLNIVQHIQPNTDLNQFDLIIADHEYPDRQNTALLTEEIVLGGFKMAPSIKPEALTHFQLISLDQSSGLRQTIDQYCQQLGINIHYQYETDDPATLRELALNGVGPTFIPENSWSALFNELEFSRILPTPPTRQIFLSQRKDRNDRAIREVISEIIGVYQ